MSTIYVCPTCDYSFTVKPGQLTTANVKTHCGLIMAARQQAQWEMSKQQAEALAEKVKCEAPDINVKIRSCVEVFEHMQGKNDGSYCIELAIPGKPQPSNVAARMARILENEYDWEQMKETWQLFKRLVN